MIQLIYKKEGFVSGFYKGVSINLIKVPIGLGLGFFIRGYLCKFFDVYYWIIVWLYNIFKILYN